MAKRRAPRIRRSGVCATIGRVPDTGDDGVDLTPEKRRRIDELFARLSELDDHGVLGVTPGSNRTAVRRAYFVRAAEFHPDRFFRKSLGPYQAKIEAITRRLSDAYEALAAQAPAAAAVPPPPVDPRREKALATLKQQLQSRQAEANRLVGDAKRAAAHGDLAGAAEAYRKAAALAPSNPGIRAAHEKASKAVDAGAADALARQAEFEERFGHWAEAARTWRRVVDARPGDTHARERLEAALRKLGSDGT
jgi:tetratricopeptide (TPR) repeat protein